MACTSEQGAVSGRHSRWRAVLATVCVLAGMACAVALGLWQLRRAEEKVAQQQVHDQARAAPPLPVSGSAVPSAQWAGRRVLVQGVWEPAHTFFLDNRTYRGVAGFYVLTPLRLTQPAAGDAPARQHVLILRGWVPRDPRDRTRLPAVPTPTTPVQIIGLAQADWAQPRVLGASAAPPEANGRLWQTLDRQDYSRQAGLAVPPLVIRQTSALPDGLVREWVEPGAGVAKHRAYAAQWFGLAGVLGGYGVLAGWRRRRGQTSA
jgi:surfeit locus 1 family protein